MTRFEGIETAQNCILDKYAIKNWNNDPIWGDWDPTPSIFWILLLNWNNDPIWGDWDMAQFFNYLWTKCLLKQWPDLRGLRHSWIKSSCNHTESCFNWNNDPIWGDWDLYLDLKGFWDNETIKLKQWPDLRGLRLFLRSSILLFISIYWNNDPIWGDWDYSRVTYMKFKNFLLKQWPDLRGLRLFMFFGISKLNSIETMTRFEGIETKSILKLPKEA